MGDRNTGLAGQQGSVAKLHSAANPAVPGALVQHGLAVHANEVDVGPLEVVAAEEILGGGEMFLSAGAGGLGEYRGRRCASWPGKGLFRGLEHEVAGGLRKLALSRRPEGGNRLALGFQDRHVHGVEGGPGHESEHTHAN